MILLLFLYGTKSRENNGPNGQPAKCMTPSEFYKNMCIQKYWKATNWILLTTKTVDEDPASCKRCISRKEIK